MERILFFFDEILVEILVPNRIIIYFIRNEYFGSKIEIFVGNLDLGPKIEIFVGNLDFGPKIEIFLEIGILVDN